MADLEKYRPIPGGCAVNDEDDNRGGTLGWFATLDSDGSLVFLTNKHVLYGDKLETARGSRKIGQPDYSGSLCCICNYVADSVIGIRNAVVDCAIARLRPEFKNVQFTIGGTDSAPTPILVTGTNATVQLNQPVRKVGISSGLTRGFVADPAATLIVPNGPQMNHQILIRPHPEDAYRTSAGVRAFNEEGDSGAVLLNDANEVIGLIHANIKRPNNPNFAPEDPDPNMLITVACHISDVLAAFAAESSAITLSKSGAGGTSLRFGGGATATPVDPTELLLDTFRRHPVAKTPLGLEVRRHTKEVTALVNQCRPVTIAWHRNQGPAFLAAVHRSARDPGFRLPREINGVDRSTAVAALVAVLEENGSSELARFGRQYSHLLRETFIAHDRVADMFDAVAAELGLAADCC